jgi:tetratricopeptide (TPR) repeat protein
VLGYRVDLAGTCCNFARLLRDGGKPADSLAWFQKAIDMLRPVHEQQPRDVRASLFLRNSHLGRAEANDQLGRFAEAVKDWDRVIKLSAKPEEPGLRAARANSHVRAGQVADAVADVAALAKISSWNAGQLYDFACIYAVASGKVAGKKQEYSARAMELLHKAVHAGFKDAAHIKQDSDLDALRDRDDFKKLLAGLEAKAPQKKK